MHIVLSCLFFGFDAIMILFTAKEINFNMIVAFVFIISFILTLLE